MLTGNDSSVKAQVTGPQGYFTGLSLTPAELDSLRAAIREQWLERIRQAAPEKAAAFAEAGMDRYHELSDMIDHEALWPKTARILPVSGVELLRSTALFRRLEAEYGPIAISDEERVGREEVYWRLVRPGQPDDVGPLHADGWFWDLEEKDCTPPGAQRVKVWIAVHVEPGLSGLRLVPGSHLKDYRYASERRGGRMKPRILENESDFDVRTMPTLPGDAVVFHDRLLHGGAPTRGRSTRVSFEFTMFVRP